MNTLNCRGRLLVVEKPVVMGIINITPDSFYSGSRFVNADQALKQVEKMLGEGATIIDIGGQSTRPGSEMISMGDEKKRVLPVVDAVCRRFPDCFVSIDTFYSDVAKDAVDAGASIVNDISAGSIDDKLIDTVAGLDVPYVLMHMKGVPGTMQDNPVYENVTREVLDFFIRKTSELHHAGIKDIIIDPGFGFGKSIEHNFQLLKDLSIFSILDKPLLVGLSRKSTIWKTLNITAEESLNGTTVLNTVGLMNGATMLRVHDVKQAAEAIKLVSQLK